MPRSSITQSNIDANIMLPDSTRVCVYFVVVHLLGETAYSNVSISGKVTKEGIPYRLYVEFISLEENNTFTTIVCSR